MEALRALIEAGPFAVIGLDQDGNVSRWNPGAVKMLGWPGNEVLGKPLPLEFNSTLLTLPENGEIDQKRRDGELLHLNVWSTALRDGSNHLLERVFLLSDATQFQHLAESERAAWKQAKTDSRFRELLEAAPDAIIEVDREGHIVLMNAVTEKIFGYTREELLGQSDFVSLHPVLNNETRRMIGARQLALMKKTAFLINTSRGAVVDEDALAAALAEGGIAGAGIDVYENEPRVEPALLKMDNVVLTPHLGSAVAELREAMAHVVVDNILAIIDGRKPPNCINPEVFAPVSQPAT